MRLLSLTSYLDIMTESLRNRIVVICICLFCGMITATSCAKQGVAYTEKKYYADISMEGGTGKASIKSPVEVIEKDGITTARFIWSSKNYDYMIVDGVRYDNENPGGESTFTVTIKDTKEPLTVIGDTVAMSTPHEIEYVITWGEKEAAEESGAADTKAGSEEVVKALEAAHFIPEEELATEYAKGFTVRRYKGFDHVSIVNSGEYLVMEKDTDIPEGLPEGVVILRKPLDRTYLVSTSAMDLINTCGALDMIRLSGTKESGWYIDDARTAMEEGRILYAGRYRSPDYELILENDCNLAIESTMIYHEPAVKAKLEELGIPVLVETSSYEEHPLGRLEWIKLYGILFDREEEARKYYDEQLSLLSPMLKERPDTGKTAAFFHVTANGMINVRKPGDYITRMIELSGGHYVPADCDAGDSAVSTMNMQMEDFYEGASNADILIYNSTIGGEIHSVDELLSMDPLFKDFKAVKDHRVYCTDRNLFQQTTGMAEFMKDLNDVFTGTEGDHTYLYRLE